MRNTATYLKITALALPALILSACGYNPNSSVPDSVQQCIGIQREILFSQDNNTLQTNNWQLQAKNRNLQNQFNKQHCYRILNQAKKDAHKPVKSAAQMKQEANAS